MFYTLNTPVNAIDPDGKLVIFVNGYYNRLFPETVGPNKGGQAYWDYFDKGFIPAANRLFNDKNYTFVDGSSLYGGDQSGAERYALGRKYAEEHYWEWNGQMKDDDEGFNLVGHSEGSAFAAGIASYITEMAWGDKKSNGAECFFSIFFFVPADNLYVVQICKIDFSSLSQVVL